MSRLNKQYYYNSSREKKLNCYHIHLSKEIVNKAGFEEDDELVSYVEYGTIVIAKKWHCTCMECDTEWDSGQDTGLWAICPRCHCGDVKFEDNGELNDYKE